MRAIYFDMDGTIADLYGYENWLAMLQAEDTTPYEKCGVLVNTEKLMEVLNEFIAAGITIGVISWGAKNGSREYCKRTRKAKKAWCDYYFPNVFTEFHVVKYGTPKHHVRKEKDSILVDDNAEVRQAWDGKTIDATKDIVLLLKKILLELQEEKRKQIWDFTVTKTEKAEEQGLFSDMFKSHRTNGSGLYFIGSTTFNPITNEKRYWLKIGKANGLKSRIDQYLTHMPDVYFIDWKPVSKSVVYDYERCYQSQLGNFAIDRRTEWFRVTEKVYFKMCEKGLTDFLMYF